jgi:hypothetical protein
VTEAPSARLSMPISIARFVLAGDGCAPDAAAAPARLGLGLDCEAARIVASPSVDRALLSTIASGSVAAAEAPGCAAAASVRARARASCGLGAGFKFDPGDPAYRKSGNESRYTIYRLAPLRQWFVADSPLERRGFEPSVPAR